jgi:lipid II:glycine glycyltransferase (peptidoglycan interpeptide bridge formation enzyme)
MISYKKKFYFFKVRETWFNYHSTFSDLFGLNIYSHVKNNQNSKIYGVKNNSYTVELSLLPGIEEITSNFRNTVKQEIRKSEKEGVECFFERDVDTFVRFYNEFAKAKNIYPANKQMIERIGPQFQISFAKLNGELLAAHSYLVDEELGIARLFHSASRRLDETFDRNVIGRANKLLTAKDIFHFKEKGFTLMDFGGYAENTEDKSMKGINEFKLSFGGIKVECVNYQSLLYYLLNKIATVLDRRFN